MTFSVDAVDAIITPSVHDKLTALVLDEQKESHSAISSIVHENGFRVLNGESPETLKRLGPESFDEIRLLVISRSFPRADEESLEQMLSLFPLVPVIFIGKSDEASAAIGETFFIAELDRPIDRDQLLKALDTGRRFAQSLDDLAQRQVFRKHPSYIEEPIARIIHDINNQMTGLKGGIDLLCYSIEMIREPETQAKFMRYMEQFIQPSLAQIEQLVGNWRRLRENRLRPLVTSDLVDLVRRSIATAANPSEQQRISLQVNNEVVSLSRCSNEKCFGYFVKASPAHLILALNYVIQNAVDATDNQDNGQIIVDIERHNDEMARVRVLDNGEGVAEAIRTQIWRSFFTTKGEWRNGLGLCIAKQIVDKHQGQIEYISSPLGGAGFQISLISAAMDGFVAE